MATDFNYITKEAKERGLKHLATIKSMSRHKDKLEVRDGSLQYRRRTRGYTSVSTLVEIKGFSTTDSLKVEGARPWNKKFTGELYARVKILHGNSKVRRECKDRTMNYKSIVEEVDTNMDYLVGFEDQLDRNNKARLKAKEIMREAGILNTFHGGAARVDGIDYTNSFANVGKSDPVPAIRVMFHVKAELLEDFMEAVKPFVIS